MKVITFDVDPVSLISLRQALPDWQIEMITGATTHTVARDWNPGSANLLVIGCGQRLADTLGLCRGLRSQQGHAHVPILVLMPRPEPGCVRAVLAAGATSCRGLPVHPKELVSLLARAQRGNAPGRHTLALDQAQRADEWRDAGGEA
ncbi:MAG: hypothetical protein JNM56_21765 [Planctomycetia bacterium]|nr:hypothetical protein [Planctomycetia bacterium]